MDKKDEIIINWEGPLIPAAVIEEYKDAGTDPFYEGNDYGLYQIYGTHILAGPDNLLYIGIATLQCFSERFKQHSKEWLSKEPSVRVYLGRIFDPQRHSRADHWVSWIEDVKLAEQTMIYKYTPNYNSVGIANFQGFNKAVRILHLGQRHKLFEEDNAPEDLCYGLPSERF